MIALGIDPGSATGIVCLEVPDDWSIDCGRWINSAAIPARTSANLPPAVTDVRFFQRTLTFLQSLPMPDLAVMENPADAAPWWGDREGAGRQRGSLYRLGVYKGLVFAALAQLGVPVVEYLVRGSKQKPGWMRSWKNRDAALFAMNVRAQRLCPGKYSEHQLMGLGVLSFHCAVMQLQALRARAGIA